MRGRIRALLEPIFEDDALVAESPPVPVREIFRRFWPYARPYRRWLLVSLLLIAVVPAVETATIWMFKVVVDQVLVPHDFGPLWWVALAYLGLTLVAGVASFLDDYVSTWVGERFLLSLRTGFFRHVQSLSLDFFDRRKLGDLISRLTGDIASIETFVLSGVADALSYVFQILFFAAALFYLQWDLALVSLFVAPLFWLTARRFSRLIKRASREKRRRSGSISSVAEESLANVALVQAYNRQETEVDRFHRENLGSFHATMASTRLRALFTPLIDLIELAGALVVIGMGTWELSQHRLSLGGLLVFTAYLAQMYGPIRRLGRLSNSLYAASASAERVIELMDEEPSVKEPEEPRHLMYVQGALDVDDVTFRYPDTESDALSHVSFQIEPGRTLALVGPSGAGKSTVAKLLLRLYDPTAGAIRLDGYDLPELELHSLRENMSLLLQEPLALDGSVRHHIAYGREGASDEEIERAAVAADAHEFIIRLPEGYDTQVGQKGRRLSGGQRQRLAIARAMIRDAPLLILDEPTTGLDAESGERVLAPLRRLMDGRSTIVISHNLMTVREADEILVLEHGAVSERGSHAELLARGGPYTRL
jgi:ABC-type multidrug transport system fused ATPase/permease subunit